LDDEIVEVDSSDLLDMNGLWFYGIAILARFADASMFEGE
jgi:hypothetical protein